MTRVEDKKDLLILMEREKKLKKTLQQYKIEANYNIIFGYKSDL